MTEWKTVHDSRAEMPETLDTTSSASTVYERRNIQSVTVTHESGSGTMQTQEWTYEQREYTAEEYAATISPATQSIMQAISGLELSVAELALGADV